MSSIETPPFLDLKPDYNKTADHYSTYRIGGPIEVAWFPTCLEDSLALLRCLHPHIQARHTTLSTIGWGSNTLIASQGITGHTLITRKLTKIQHQGDGVFIIEAGVHLAKVAHTVMEAGYSLGEYMIGIPATMGGATVMNAGAMGQETAHIVERALIFDLDQGEAHWQEASQLGYAYRYSTLKPTQHIVLATQCRFLQGDPHASQAKMDANMQFRKTHHPMEPNGGSVFRNPSDAPSVGQMIDELGGKGQWRVGGAEISRLHGNFIINTGHATSWDVLSLMRQMQVAVWDTHQIRIYPENRFIGHASSEERDLWHALTEGDLHHDP